MYSFSAPEVEAIWQQVCAELQLQLSPAVFNTWIRNNPLHELHIGDDESAQALFMSPTAFHANNIRKNLYGTIKQTLDKVVGKDCELEWRVGTPGTTAPQSIGIPGNDNNTGNAASSQSAPSLHNAQNSPELSSEPPRNQSVQKIGHTIAHNAQPGSMLSDRMGGSSHAPSNYNSQHSQPSSTPYPYFPPPPMPNSSVSPRVEDLFSQHNMSANAVDRAVVSARQAGLRTDYTFEAFAVSTTNEMAHAAATAVSNRPGTAYNPLFLYGGVGVGKTHLMHAIGNNILKNSPDIKILYCTGEEFTNEIVSAIQNKKAIKFKEKYRNAQVLLIDDIQFIAGKNAVQEEFFHTFNALSQQARQVVLTSDRPPHEINLLEDRLRSRFEAGLMIDIQAPSFELRTAILLIKSGAAHVNIPMDLAQVIASKVDSARKIEGIITSIRSEVELKKRPITADLIDEILKTETEKKRPALKVSPTDIVKTVANHYRLKQAAIKGKQRHQPLVQARHVAMYLFKEELNMPYTEIGRWFTNRDHTSALHAVRKIEQELSFDEVLQRDISALRMSLTAISR